MERLKIVFETASKEGLHINWSKCCFLRERVEFLGHIIKNGVIRSSERKTEAVKRFAEPKNIRQLQAFLGLTGYFRKFIANYARIARPLTDFLRANAKFNFGDRERKTFEMLKDVLSQNRRC